MNNPTTSWQLDLRLLLFLIFCLNSHPLLFGQSNQPPNGWYAFADVEFKRTLMEDGMNYLLVPQFDERIKALEGQEVRLRGYVMPFDYGDLPFVILSKYPYASCFFCGAAGPESVAEIHFNNQPPPFRMDEQIVIVGYLRLNDSDINQMNFILEECRVVDAN